MKTLFSLINLVAGSLCLLVGLAIFLSVSYHPQNTGAGVVAVCIAAVCLWLAKESAVERQALLT